MRAMENGIAKEDLLARRVEVLLRKLTLREKIALLSGQDAWRTAAIPRLSLPSLVMTDGPHGVRSTRDPGRIHGPATSFPTGIAMAASWNPELIERVGMALAEETLAMGCDILLGPCINIVRIPLGGRSFESFGEDPYLAGRLAVAYVRGLQSRGVGASVKHFACNNQETERMRGSSVVDERTLREIYLPAFEAAVKEADPWTVMCSYNKINGVYASEHRHLLREILKGEWGFVGAVISDWGATHSTVPAIEGGLDLEMPGPAKYFGDLLHEAVWLKLVDESVIDESVRRILRLIVLSGRLDEPAARPAGAANTPEHQALAGEVAEESIVLLKNEGDLLPLHRENLGCIAVIGPNARSLLVSGGGSACLEPPYVVSPWEALVENLGDSVRLEYERGCDNHAGPPIIDGEWLLPPEGQGRGLLGEYFAGAAFSGAPAFTRLDERFEFWWWGSGPDRERMDGKEYSVRWRGHLVPPESGLYEFRLEHTGICRFHLGGELDRKDELQHRLLYRQAPLKGSPGEGAMGLAVDGGSVKGWAIDGVADGHRILPARIGRMLKDRRVGLISHRLEVDGKGAVGPFAGSSYDPVPGTKRADLADAIPPFVLCKGQRIAYVESAILKDHDIELGEVDGHRVLGPCRQACNDPQRQHDEQQPAFFHGSPPRSRASSTARAKRGSASMRRQRQGWWIRRCSHSNPSRRQPAGAQGTRPET
ncbi:MAG: glycoside hydrolase family 3 C-terminal domain-containing protein [Anaerolineae bacterium]|nr:glycoside hydrolase family 3 C-terminal domain-containing protein [Anaerolineae bacterium]